MKEVNRTTIEDIFTPTAKNASLEMRFSRMLFLTKDGKPYSPITNEYADKLKNYSTFCVPQKQREWINRVDNFMNFAGIISDEEFNYRAYDFECAGEILELMSQNPDWKQVHELVYNQGHTGSTMSSMSQLLLVYSNKGTEFVEKEVGKRLSSLENLNKVYKKIKKSD